MRGIKRLKNGRWQITLMYKGRIVKRRLPSRKLAILTRQKMMVEMAEGRYLNINKKVDLPFSEAARIFLEFGRGNSSVSLQKIDRQVMSKCKGFAPLWGKVCQEITTREVYEFKGYLSDMDKFEGNAKRATGEKLSKRSVDIALSRLSRMFSLMVRLGYLTDNPAKHVSKYNADNRRTRILSEEEEAGLLEACPPYFRAVVVMALYTGMRKGEVLGLTWKEVSPDFAFVTVSASRSKNRRARSIPLCETARDLVAGLYSTGVSGETPVFRSPEGHKVGNLGRLWVRAIRKAGIEDLRFHDLRHTFASRAVMAGISLYSVKELLGHSSFAMTSRYAHLAPSHLLADMATFSEKWKKTGNIGVLQGKPGEAAPGGLTLSPCADYNCAG